MASLEPEYPCLYCRGEGRKTDEHVLQAAFGADVVLVNEVCHDCNTRRFSALDGHLVGYVRMLARAKRATKDPLKFLRAGHKNWRDPDDGHWKYVRVEKGGVPVMFPQFLLDATPAEEGQVVEATFATDGLKGDYEKELAAFRRELAKPDQCKFSRLVFNPDTTPPAQAAIVRTGKKRYLVRARTDDHIDRWLKVLSRGRFAQEFLKEGTPRSRTSQNVRVESRVSINFGGVQRATAKVALNSLCYLVGPDIARDELFDPIREYVLHGSGAIENDFVVLISKENGDDYFQKFVADDAHAIMFVPGAPSAIMIALYGLPFALVWLNPHGRNAPTSLSSTSHALLLVNFETGQSEVVRMEDDPISFGHRFKLFPQYR